MADQPKEERSITALTVCGFKSLHNESRIEIRNLTVLAGANSSGKSSIVQPLLMLKQTLDASYDPGPLKLDGPNVRFTSIDQFLLKTRSGRYQDLVIGLEIDGRKLSNQYRKVSGKREIELLQTAYIRGNRKSVLRKDKPIEKVLRQFPSSFDSLRTQFEEISKPDREINLKWNITRTRIAFGFELFDSKRDNVFPIPIDIGHGAFEELIGQIIHVPGLRGNPQRSYLATPVIGPEFEGTFENYAAAVINFWYESASEKLHILGSALAALGLTSNVTTERLDYTRVELRVGRTLHSEAQDMVNIADVGFGVSQVLPVLVALLVAKPGQLVYIEQPELHLHPRAQVKLAEIIAEAANRGVRVVIETHSDLLLIGIQTLVAKRELSTEKVIFHWFERDEEGVTHITPTELNEDGTFKDATWPEDFGEVALRAQSDFLDASEPHQMER